MNGDDILYDGYPFVQNQFENNNPQQSIGSRIADCELAGVWAANLQSTIENLKSKGMPRNPKKPNGSLEQKCAMITHVALHNLSHVGREPGVSLLLALRAR